MINRSTWWTVATAAAMLAGTSMATGQTATAAKDEKAKEAAPAQQPRKIKSVRKSVVDLEAMAKERRPGQVMPGDPAPVMRAPAPASTTTDTPTAMQGGMAATTLPAPAADALPTKATPIQLPDTAPANRSIMKPESDPSGRTTSIEPPAPVTPAPTAVAPAGATATAAMPQEEVHAAAVPAAVATDLTKTPKIITGHSEPLPHMDAGPAEPVVSKIESAKAESVKAEAPKAEAVKAEAIKVESAKAETPAPETGKAADTGVALVDGAIVPSIPMAMSTAGARLKIESISGDASGVQWRVPGESWRTPGTAESVEGKMEIRAGLDSEMVIVVDDRVQLRVSRLGRALIERSQEAGGTTAVSVTLSRGAVEIRPLKDAGLTAGEMFARVRTPDQMFGVTGALRVEYDAFTGTRRRTVNP